MKEVNKTSIPKIGFWKPTDEYGEFSNWYLCPFKYSGITFNSSEQALMWSKAVLFKDTDTASKILKTSNQKDIKQLGREVKNYDDEAWSKIRYSKMVEILYEKFSQNKSLKSKLLSTQRALIYEASPLDKIWGIGSEDVNVIKGENLLGRALMEVRNILLEEDDYNKNKKRGIE